MVAQGSRLSGRGFAAPASLAVTVRSCRRNQGQLAEPLVTVVVPLVIDEQPLLLERDLGVAVGNLEQSDIAHDIHIWRLLLRTRLAERDDRDHMIAVARQLHPPRPGALAAHVTAT